MSYRYFSISQGLRGCYMPDSAYEIRVKTRRELKDVLESEAYSIRDAGFLGCNKKAIAWLANAAWKGYGGRNYLPYVAPYRNPDSPGNFCYGLFAAPSTRDDWKTYERESM